MTRLLLRTVLAAAAAAIVLASTPLVPAGAQSDPSTTTTTKPESKTGAPVTPSGDPAIDDLVGCVQGSRELLVLFLIDESASLKKTDPDNRRVDAARGALDSLVALASSEGAASPRVAVSLAAFSNEFRTVQDWTAAGPDTADGLNDSLEEFASFNGGKDTDFVNALSAGREVLADQAAEVTRDGGDVPCRAIMLFTDGGYDLGVRASVEDQKEFGTTKPYAPGIELTTEAQVKKAEGLGRRALCEPSGVADQIRSDDITLLTVALSGTVSRAAQWPLAAATTGKADGRPCGTQPKKGESSRTQGAYLPAEDIDVLITQFNGVGTRLAGGSLVPGSDRVEICDDAPCDGTRTFTLDRTLRRAQIIALPPAAGATVVVEAPDGEKAEISEAGSAKVGSTQLVARSVAERGLAIDLARPADDASWNGDWKVSIVDSDQKGDQATLQVYVFSDIGVAFGQVPTLERGSSDDLEVVLQLPEGVQAADVVETAEATVRLRDPVTGRVDEVPLEGKPNGPFTGTFTTPKTMTSNVVEATAEVRITTTGGALLVSQSAPAEALVRRPQGSIQFAPGSLQMPSLTGEGSTQQDLVIVGGDGPGCAWFGKTAVPDPPDGASPIAITLAGGKALPGEDDCIKVGPSETVTITVEATPTERASGAVVGTIEVFEKVDGASKASTTQLPFRFDMARGVDQAQRLLLSLVMLVAGLGFPLLLLMVLNAISARFQDLDAVQGTALPVRVNGRTITRVDKDYARPLSLRTDDFATLATAGHNRRFTFGGVEFRARASRNPFGATMAMAVPEGGATKLKGKVGSRVELDPALAGSWIFLLDSDKTRLAGNREVVGLLIAFVAEGNVGPQADRMLPDIERRLPDTATRLAGLVRSVHVKAKKAKRGETAAEDVVAGDADEQPPAPPVDPGAAPGPVSDADPEPEAPPAAEGAVEAPTPSEPSTEPEAPADAEPSTPLGFGGVARGGVPSRPANPPEAPGDDDDDDGPGGPPVGFTGVRPD